MKTWYKKGSFNAVCDVCGQRFKASELMERWDGLMVDAACFEPRHPQDFLRVPEEHTETPWARPESEEIFKPVCYIWSRSAYADLAEADCALADNTLLPYIFLKTLKDGL